MSDLKVDGIIASTGTNTALTLQGKGTGKVSIGDGALLFPDADGSADQIISTNASGVLSFVTPAAGGLTILAEVATTSGTSVALTTAIPSTATFVVINVTGVSTNNANGNPYVQLGDSGGLETSAYVCTNGRIVSTTPAIGDVTDGFVLANHTATGDTCDGMYFLSLQDATNHVWCFQGLCRGAATKIYYSMGVKTLSADLDRISILARAGAFDAGVASVSYM